MNNSAIAYSVNGSTHGFACAERTPQIESISAIESYLNADVSPQPLLALQRLSFEQKSAVCISDDFRSAQRYFSESIRSRDAKLTDTYLVHEMMPGHQRDYIMDCIDATRRLGNVEPVSIFTSQNFMGILRGRLPWLRESHIVTTPQHPKNSSLSKRNTKLISSEPVVSCICLRTGVGNRWLLMDHDVAAVVSPNEVPSASVVRRLLHHTVSIGARRLAPYLAMMFDVPDTWKECPELATRSLLIFDKHSCLLGCPHPEIPTRIVWSEMLGLMY